MAVFPYQLLKENLANYVQLPKYHEDIRKTRDKLKIINMDQYKQILEITPESDSFYISLQIAFNTGLRRGEVLALNVDRDVDFQAMTITVREAVRFEANQPILVDPKTEAGIRVIPMLDILADELKGRHGLVATMAQGEMLSETGFRRAWAGFITSLEEIHNGSQKRWYGHRVGQNAGDMPPWIKVSIRPHDLRHSYCTMLYDSGIDLKTAQKWMGHADQTMTLRVYTHLTAEREEESARLLREKVNERVQNGVQSIHGVQSM